jgi:hypothetical protein
MNFERVLNVARASRPWASRPWASSSIYILLTVSNGFSIALVSSET